MPLHELITAAVLVVVLVGIVVFFSWQEIRNLRRAKRDLLREDGQRIRFRAWRRLFCCLLLLVLAGLLVGNYFVDHSRETILEPGEDGGQRMSDEQRDFARFYGAYWILILIVLLAVILIVAYDLWSLRRWGLREQRRLHEDHREQLQHDVSEYLRQRNGHKG